MRNKNNLTSLKVSPDLWKEVKIWAIRHDITATELVDQSLKAWIKEHTNK